jgi:hypothetical protein
VCAASEAEAISRRRVRESDEFDMT